MNPGVHALRMRAIRWMTRSGASYFLRALSSST